jgi:small subunit ribosomal protein S6
MRKYEIMYILRADLDEAARQDEMKKLQTVLESNHAKVTDVKEWGVKDFAYKIKEQSKGYYVILKVTAEPAALNEWSRLAKLDANVIRHLITVDQD